MKLGDIQKLFIKKMTHVTNFSDSVLGRPFFTGTPSLFFLMFKIFCLSDLDMGSVV